MLICFNININEYVKRRTKNPGYPRKLRKIYIYIHTFNEPENNTANKLHKNIYIVRRYKILTLKKVENSWKFAGGSCVRGIFNAESKNRERERKNVNKT